MLSWSTGSQWATSNRLYDLKDPKQVMLLAHCQKDIIQHDILSQSVQ